MVVTGGCRWSTAWSSEGMMGMLKIISSSETAEGFGCRYRVTRRRLVLFWRLTLWRAAEWTRVT